MARFDWSALERAGLLGLGLKPSDFWSLTPRELTVMLGHDPGAAPLDRARLMALSQAYPDEKGKK